MRSLAILFAFISNFLVFSAFSSEFEELEKSCKEGNSQSCILATDYLFDHSYIADGFSIEDRVSEILFEGCNLGDPNSCERLVNYYYSGELFDLDVKKLIKAEELGCKLDNIQCCINIAEGYAKGINRKKDHLKAYKYYKKSCDLNDGESCNIAAIYNNYSTSIKDFPKGFSNPKLAIKFYRRGCRLKSGYSCRNLAVAYLLGYGVNISKQSAIANYKLAIKYGYTEGVRKDVQLKDLGFTIKLDN